MTDKYILPLVTISAALQDIKLHNAAKECGISYPTLRRIANNDGTDHTMRVVAAVSDYLIRQAELVLKDRPAPKPVIDYNDCLSSSGIESVKPDYQKYVTDNIRDKEVCDLADTLLRQDVSIGAPLLKHVLATAGCCSIADLNQDGLDRAYFELKLLTVGAKLTYERVQHQRHGMHPVNSRELLDTSYAELKELEQCALDVGFPAKQIEGVIVAAGRRSGSNALTVEDQDQRGMAEVYQRLVIGLVNQVKTL